MKNVTIKDVAKYADVSPSTVSRVIADSPRISAATKERVKASMKKLGYHPNAIARSLVMQRTNTIGLVMSRPTEVAFANPFISEIIQGISTAARKEHFSLMLAAAKDYKDEQEEAYKMLRNKRVDGVILMASRVNDELIKQLLDNNFPFVLIGRSLELDNIPLVNNDNIQAAFTAVEFLINKNHKKIALLAGPEEFVVTRDRMNGYLQALEKHGISQQLVVNLAEFGYQAGYEGARSLLKANPNLEAIFALDDMLALGAVRAAQELGIDVPQQLAVIGFNDDPVASYIKPALTTVSIPILEMGAQASQMLIKMITEEDYHGEELIIPTRIIERCST